MKTLIKNPLFIISIVTILAGGIGFVSGMKYTERQQPPFVRQFNGGGAGRNNQIQFQGGQNGQMMRFRPIVGEILKKDNTSITIRTPDGGSKIILFSDTTDVSVSQKGSLDTLTIGENISVIGEENTDGSVTANSIRIGDMFQIRDASEASPLQK